MALQATPVFGKFSFLKTGVDDFISSLVIPSIDYGAPNFL
jgi:hypothetical protein